MKPRSRYRVTWDIHAQGGQAYTFAELMIRIGLLPIIGFIWIALKIGFMPAMTVMLLLIIGLAGLCKLMKKSKVLDDAFFTHWYVGFRKIQSVDDAF